MGSQSLSGHGRGKVISRRPSREWPKIRRGTMTPFVRGALSVVRRAWLSPGSKASHDVQLNSSHEQSGAERLYRELKPGLIEAY